MWTKPTPETVLEVKDSCINGLGETVDKYKKMYSDYYKGHATTLTDDQIWEIVAGFDDEVDPSDYAKEMFRAELNTKVA